MEQRLDLVVANPTLLYVLVVLGAIGVYLAMPRRKLRLEIIGLLVGGAALAGAFALFALPALSPEASDFPYSPAVSEAADGGITGGALPGIYFYVFAVIALGAAVRMITHPRPVYAALHFILSILATAGLFLALSAEFMAFSLVIIYAGAILITYLFVIMLATQAPTEDQPENLAEYDLVAREPVAAIFAGFIMLAVLTTMLGRGVPALPVGNSSIVDNWDPNMQLAAEMPRKLETALRRADLITDRESLARDAETGEFAIDPYWRTAEVGVPGPDGARRTVEWPEDFTITNPEAIGFDLIAGHPGAIEIAGIVLLMAMLGAVVLARKQIQIEEAAKHEQASALGKGAPEGGSA